MCITSLSLVISKIHKVYKHNGDTCTCNSKSLKLERRKRDYCHVVNFESTPTQSIPNLQDDTTSNYGAVFFSDSVHWECCMQTVHEENRIT